MTLDTALQEFPVRRGHRVNLVRWVSATLLLFAAVLGVRWDTSDELLQGYGNTVSGPVPPGHTMFFGFDIYATSHRPTIDVSRLHLRVVTNTADADISVRRCVPRPLAAGIGAVDDWVRFCASVDRFTSGSLSLDPLHVQIVLAVSPHRAGVVDVQGADLSYRHQLRFGRQHVGQRVMVTATG